MASSQEQSEIEQLQLSEKEEEFIGQCWDGIQDSGKLGMDGLGTLCDTLGITMEVINLAVTGLCTDDLTMDCNSFILLMGRMLRSGALKLPQASTSEGSGEEEGAKGTSSQEPPTGQSGEPEVEEVKDANEMLKIKLSEREEDYIAQCWDGVRENGRLDMTGLRALCETLGIPEEVINLAVTGLGDENCTMDRGDFMLLMGRLLRSGALKLSAGAEPEEEPNEPQAKAGGPTWMSAMTVEAEDEEGPADEATAKAATAAWIASMTVADEDDDEAAAGKQTGTSAWMASMKNPDGEDVDEVEPAEPAEPAATKADGMAALLAASVNVEGEDVDEDAEGADEPTKKAGMEAWMASMVLDDGEDVDEQEGKVPSVKSGGASAWLASMVGNDDEDADEAQAPKPAVGTNAWMASMVESGDGDN